ncbi:zinc finger and SCAN domain-containing protein 2-like [Esox lucius]|uniref:C2H2-type domain-containing protein n=1 Tax=Esox lucius TaxID=8010 RepID=A0A3P8ZQU2_ESOLU|nr:zinc finger and SCAN domain-containing protein 2-like [Esox lucius]
MSKIHLLRAFLNERLTAAAEEIFGVVEKTIAEYQEEVVRLQSLLDIVLQPKIKPHRAELQQLTILDSEFPPEQQQHRGLEWSPNHGLEDPEPTQIKEELQRCPDEEQFQGLEEDDNDSTPVFVKSDHYEDNTQSSQLYQAQKEGNGDRDPLPITTTEKIKTEPNGEDYGESEPTHVPHTLTVVNPEYSAASREKCDLGGMENGDLLHFKQVKSKKTKMIKGQSSCMNTKSWKPTQLSPLKSPSQISATSCCCMVCGKSFHYMGSLFKHMQTHTKDKKGICGACGKCFQSTESMKDHLQTHFAARFSCNFCGKFFTRNGTLKTHMRIHTGEKPYRCPYCCKGFISGGDLKNHIRIHTGEKPFCCPDCGKSFTRSGHLKGHMRTHTVDK